MEKKQPKNPNTAQVINLPTGCRFEKCTHKASRYNFCEEHYSWFKAGLITKTGQKPKDFDKKYRAYLRKNKAA